MNKKSQEKQLKIGIDARFYGPIGKGLGRYTQRLIENLEKIDSKNKYVIFLRRENWSCYQPKNRKFKKVLAPLRWYTISEQFFMPMLVNNEQIDLMHFPHFNVPLVYQGPFVVTIHDLVLEHFPTQKASTLSPIFYKIKRAGYKKVITSALKRAQRILAPSEYTKEELIKHFSLEKDKIKVTYEGAPEPKITNYKLQTGIANFSSRSNRGLKSAILQIPTSNILQKYGIMKPYILYVGNAYPHKNLERLILAFERLNQDYQLVLVGEEDYFYKRLKEYSDTNIRIHTNDTNDTNIIFTGFVRDGDLEILYKNASLYIFPSLCEGFGLPPLEAMACGVPVVSSNKTCLPEILGQAAYYFNPRSIDDIARTIKKVTTDEDLRKELITKGFERIKKYSWQKMAEKTLEIYEDKFSKKNFQTII